MTSTAVRVGLRVRPLTQKEQLSNCTECISFIPNEPQILVGTDKSFTYDYVFSNETQQNEVYEKAASPLLEKFVEGFNATILAYGQTGSGKTFSMGTGLEASVNPEHEGIVPRCIVDLFRRLKEESKSNEEYNYQVSVSFLELYNEELIDLLNPQTALKKKGTSSQVVPIEVTIREDIAGNIYWSGVKEEPCNNPEDVVAFLAKGSLCRTTGSTDMNTVSSRSHAVFSLILKHQKSASEPSVTSKFHFVDLAGSERLKRTNAQGDRAREGISINSGLLALGNVISALGDDSRKTTHIPYRDSKLTRLLQDSLGGNSQTLMLACVSPADSNFMETLNTLKYANRARNIKNRVTINQDFAGSSIEVNQLKAQLARVRMELASVRAEGSGSFNSENETKALRAEVSKLHSRMKDMSIQIVELTSERDTMVIERDLGQLMNNAPNDPVTAHPLVAQYQKTIQDLTHELTQTRDRVNTLESTRVAPNIMPPISFSSTTSNYTNRRNTSHTTSIKTKRKRYPKNTSSVTANMAARKTGKVSVRRSPLATRSSSLRTNPKRREVPRDIYHDDDEGYVNEEDYQLEDEIKQSIAKAKEEIQKGMEVLDLIRPMEEATQSWEDELEAFERAEKEIYERATQMERTDSDEGNYTLTSSPVDPLDMAVEIEGLSVPSWTSPATKSIINRKIPSLDDFSFASESMTESGQDKSNEQLARVLHQIQSDIRVKEELVTHLENTETKYAFMRRKFDERIEDLHRQLRELQEERDQKMTRTRQSFVSTPTNRADVTMQIKEKQQLIETRHTYENKTKHLVTEIQELKRTYTRTVDNMKSTKHQQENLLKTLRGNVETLKLEKKRMIKRMKQETDRVRDQMSIQEKKITKLQRQHSESSHARQRLEREHETQKATLKRRDKEMLISQNQIKMLTDLVKKAVREGGTLDDQLLSKVSHIIGGSFAAVARRGGMRNLPGYRVPRKRKNPVPTEDRVSRKKKILDKMLFQFIQGKQTIVEMKQLLSRRERLAEEKIELMEERKNIYMAEQEASRMTGQNMDTLAVDLTDERIDLIQAEISYLSARIRTLQSEAADAADEMQSQSPEAGKQNAEKRKVTFADDIVTESNDEWADMDTLDEQFNVPTNAAPELVYDATIKLLKSLEVDECRHINVALVDDIFNSRMGECNRQMAMQNLEKTVHDLRRTLIVMKRAAITTTAENERKIRKMDERVKGQSKTETMDNKIEDYIMNSGNTIFDKIYEDGLRGLLSTPEPDYAVNSSPEGSSTSSSSLDRRYSSQSDGIMPPPSPIATPAYTHQSSRPATGAGVRPPMNLTEKSLRTNGLTARELTPSPDRFYNMIQKRLSHQQRLGGTESPVNMSMVNPAEFNRYSTDRESSTSSIRSNHIRRGSLQSDYSSSQGSYNNTVSSQNSLMRKRSSSLFQQNVLQQNVLQQNNQAQQILNRRRTSLREMSKGVQPIGPILSNNSTQLSDYEFDLSMMSPSVSLQRVPQLLKRHSLASSSTLDRSGTPTGGNVFARLSQTPTRASQAKISHRHSSSSMDELRLNWEHERSPSAMSDVYQVE